MDFTQNYLKRSFENVSTKFTYPSKKIKKNDLNNYNIEQEYSDNNDSTDSNEHNDTTDLNEHDDSTDSKNNKIITYYINIKPINLTNANANNDKYGSDSGSDSDSDYDPNKENEELEEEQEQEEEDDEEDEDEDEDEEEEEDNNTIIDNDVKSNGVKYFDSSDSSDSENELNTSNPKKFALNMLKKTKRHNNKDKARVIATKFNNKVKKMNQKYKEYSKNPSKFRMLREFKKNLDECKNLFNLLDDDINYYGTKFNFDLFYKKYDKLKIKKNQDDNKNIIRPNLIDLLFGDLQNNKKILSHSGSKLDKEFEELYEHDNKSHNSGLKYFKTLNDKSKLEYINKLKKIVIEADSIDKRPNYMKILDMDLNESNKALILQRVSQLENSSRFGGDSKLKNWINKIMKVPFGVYVKPPVLRTDPIDKIKTYLDGVRKELDSEIFGHQVSKDQLVKILAHTITNPKEGGNIFALQGPPGVGKTALIQDGISKALGRPFAFISLGGATDACFLEGHDFTYEGSNHGRIVEILQQAKCMNPVIYFDELDKVSDTAKGEEIINILMHLTDQTQNSHYNDKYFGGIDFDLSKAIIIFSFNNEQKISRILRDRMKIIRVKGYKLSDKLKIANDYLIPKLIKQVGMDDFVVNFSQKIVEYLIENYTNEGGVRKLKEILNDIMMEINLRRLEGNKIIGKKIKSPLTITEEMIEKDFLKKKQKIVHIKINKEPMIGQVNGLWANELGIGGLIPIESCWIPSTEKLELELTGMQGDVMKESMSVARSVAWRILPDYIKSRLNERWKTTVDFGIHIHCPDGSTPKDGPSAGGAITTCLISLLTGTNVNNQVAMTGEINLKGNITAIGGLEEKIFGAKKAGVRLVLCPRENSKDLDEIIEKFPNLFDRDFQVKLIDNIWDILGEVITESIDWIRFD